MTTSTSQPEGLVRRVVGWLRAGYPDGVPAQDYVALLGILRGVLTPTELETVVQRLSEDVDSGRAIVTRSLVEEQLGDVVKGPPLEADVRRVSTRLAAGGWPLSGADDLDGGPGPDESEGSDRLVTRVVSWLRRGYPTGLPDHDFIPLLALLRRRLGDEDVELVARDLVTSGTLPPDRVDIGVAISQVTADLPSEDDIERVRRHVGALDWPPPA